MRFVYEIIHSCKKYITVEFVHFCFGSFNIYNESGLFHLIVYAQ